MLQPLWYASQNDYLNLSFPNRNLCKPKGIVKMQLRNSCWIQGTSRKSPEWTLQPEIRVGQCNRFFTSLMWEDTGAAAMAIEGHRLPQGRDAIFHPWTQTKDPLGALSPAVRIPDGLYGRQQCPTNKPVLTVRRMTGSESREGATKRRNRSIGPVHQPSGWLRHAWPWGITDHPCL